MAVIQVMDGWWDTDRGGYVDGPEGTQKPAVSAPLQQLIDAQKTLDWGSGRGAAATIVNPDTGQRELAYSGFEYNDGQTMIGDALYGYGGLFVPQSLALEWQKELPGKAWYETVGPGLRAVAGQQGVAPVFNQTDTDQRLIGREFFESLAIPTAFVGGHLLTGGGFGGGSFLDSLPGMTQSAAPIVEGGASAGAGYIPEAAIMQQAVPGALEASIAGNVASAGNSLVQLGNNPTYDFGQAGLADAPSGYKVGLDGGVTDVSGFNTLTDPLGPLNQAPSTSQFPWLDPYMNTSPVNLGTELSPLQQILNAVKSATGAAKPVAEAAGTTTGLAKLLGYTGEHAGAVDALGRAIPGLIGAYAANEQANSLTDLAKEFSGYGAPSRARYEASMTPGFDPTTIPGYSGALDTASDSILRRLSATGGNPYGNPGGLIEANKAIVSGTALPAIQEYQRTNAGAGGLANLAAAYPQTQAATTSAGSGVWGGFGDVAASIFTPKSSLADLFKQFKSSLA